MTDPRPLRIAIVAGEESGDLLGADLVDALQAATGRPVELIGVGGRHLRERGLVPLFDGSEIALMGVTAVLRDLPRLMRRIGRAADAIAQARPDCLITIDVPDFSLRVARKVRAKDRSIPIVHYVCPSVWAWRPGRAPAMRGHVDRILCILPFEPEELRRLGGPPGFYVGHRLATHPGLLAAAQEQRKRSASHTGKRLLVLPGSRRSEISRLMEPFVRTVEILKDRGGSFEVTLPTVPHVAGLVEEATRGWPVPVTLIHGEADKWEAFGKADAALAASGTVSLELALARVPLISCYRTDPLAKALSWLIVAWSGSLPNLIADWPVVPEYYNEYVRPAHLARLIERLWAQTPQREAQLAGFDAVAGRLRTDRPSGELAAQAVLDLIGK